MRELLLKLQVHQERVTHVCVERQKIDIQALLHRRSIEEGMSLLPSVFSVCTHAQSAAAWGALTTAAGESIDENTKMQQTLAVQVESIQESLRSLTFQLPEELRDMHMMCQFAQVWQQSNLFLSHLRQAIQQKEAVIPDGYRTVLVRWNEFCATYVFGNEAAAFLEKAAVVRNLGEFPPTPVWQWFRRLAQDIPLLGRAAIHSLPCKHYRYGTVSWQDLTTHPYDASCWLRVHKEPAMRLVIERFGNNAAARIAARMVDVARTLTILFGDYEGSPWVRAYRVAEQYGTAEVKCARGVLMHRARVENGEIIAYDICAPTDWNLHEKGALLTLVGASAKDQERLLRYANELVQALDPCVAFEIKIDGA